MGRGVLGAAGAGVEAEEAREREGGEAAPASGSGRRLGMAGASAYGEQGGVCGWLQPWVLGLPHELEGFCL